VVLNMARQGEDLKAVASFHGGLAAVKPATTGKVKAKIRVYNGEDDKFSPQQAIDAFMQEMRDARVDFQFINYPGAVHSFTNPEADELGKKFGLPLAYNAEADKRSWADMADFFAEVFKK
jgi:dienelactone hydrolase